LLDPASLGLLSLVRPSRGAGKALAIVRDIRVSGLEYLKAFGLQAAGALVLGLFASLVVIERGWIHDDAFISFRYASNILDGHGPVFNLGDHVQGFTHPLWLGVLTIGLAIAREPLYLAVILGGSLTLLTVTGTTAYLFHYSRPDLAKGILLAAGWTLAVVASDSWLSFQTGGLENCLTHFLIAVLVIEMLRDTEPRPFVLTLLASLIWLTRPDTAFLLAPLGLVVLAQCWRARRFLPLLGTVPAILWLIFALAYYGELTPNTADAKLGIFGSWQAAARQGLDYVYDWIQHEPLPAALSIGGLGLVLGLARNRYHWALAAGALLYAVYIVYIGGDYMRGRFMLVFYFTIVTLAAFLMANQPIRVPLRHAAAVGFAGLMLFAFFHWARPPRTADISAQGISDERMFYAGFQLETYRRTGQLSYMFYTLDFIAELKAYAEQCGGMTMHTATVGAIAYFAGPDVTIIDTVGLNDDRIAALPRTLLAFDPPRVGHPLKFIPLDYLASRQDISIFAGWEGEVYARNCAFKDQTAQFASSAELLHPLGVLPYPPDE
jgi:arabinofuranosyltransferase